MPFKAIAALVLIHIKWQTNIIFHQIIPVLLNYIVEVKSDQREALIEIWQNNKKDTLRTIGKMNKITGNRAQTKEQS